ncbi:hypothetical protein N9119_03130 [Roseivirga sp.]|jgi:hypothetical protein|nr:hypothetical protein [Roseivirga sp.]|tara:strand:+ start:2050 stop:2409 length:360 start_codon:yes stop_codon:yes gene_type:complete
MLYNNDFGHDLLVGQVAEQFLGDLLQNKKIEVKHDKIAHRSGRVFIEYECRNKPSGITTTNADFWAFVFTTGPILIVSKDRLTSLCNKAYENSHVFKGGDNNSSKGFLINLTDLIQVAL